MTQFINEEVDIDAYYFAGKDLKTFPRRMEYGGREVTFESGLRCRVQRAGQMMYLFDMSGHDGITYQLRQLNNQWTLVATR